MDSANLVNLLHETDIWPEDEALQRQVLDWQRQFPEARQFAGQLLKGDLLTPYQANQLLTGKGKSLLLGPYLVLERVGEGGMGQVFKARHRKLRRIVALKLITKERCGSLVAVRRFLREVEVCASLTHPNLVRAYDADQVGDTWYFAMQYVDGTDLSKLVKKSGPLAIDQAIDYAVQATLGLQHIARHGLVHRDIKPSNLMVTRLGAAPSSVRSEPTSAIDREVGPWGRLKILDLGLARLVEGESVTTSRPQLTHVDTVMGTADFMSPEQAIHSSDVDIRSDIYSLGCTLYFLLTGQPPYPGGNAVDKLLRHQLEQPQLIENLRPEIPAALRSVLRRMMTRKPVDRFQTPTELANALLNVSDPNAPANDPPVSVALLPVEPPAPEPPPLPWETAPTDAFAFDVNEPVRSSPTGRRDPSMDWRPWVVLAASLIGIALMLVIVLKFFWR